MPPVKRKENDNESLQPASKRARTQKAASDDDIQEIPPPTKETPKGRPMAKAKSRAKPKIPEEENFSRLKKAELQKKIDDRGLYRGGCRNNAHLIEVLKDQFNGYTIEGLKQVIEKRKLSHPDRKKKVDYLKVLEGPAHQLKRIAEANANYARALDNENWRAKNNDPKPAAVDEGPDDDNDLEIIEKPKDRTPISKPSTSGDKVRETRRTKDSSRDIMSSFDTPPGGTLGGPSFGHPNLPSSIRPQTRSHTGRRFDTDDMDDFSRRYPDEVPDVVPAGRGVSREISKPVAKPNMPAKAQPKSPSKKANAVEPGEADESEKSFHDSDSSAKSSDGDTKLLRKVTRRMKARPKKSSNSLGPNSDHLTKKLIDQLSTRLETRSKAWIKSLESGVDNELDEIICRKADYIRGRRGQDFAKDEREPRPKTPSPEQPTKGGYWIGEDEGSHSHYYPSTPFKDDPDDTSLV